jgi:pimeloyl-ACP methyl ester carboxylesterase
MDQVMRYLYLHGFASGPQSTKGIAFEKHYAARGIAIARLDLRVPSFEHLRLSAMIDTVRGALTGPTVLIGSSLGGLTAAHVGDPRIEALVLMAPAFGLVARWREQLGTAWDEWQRSGWRQVTDYTTGQPARIDFGFVEDVGRIDRGVPRIDCPTLILHGTRDETVPIGRSRELAKQQPNVRLVELDDGHELVASLPAILAETDRFLAGV